MIKLQTHTTHGREGLDIVAMKPLVVVKKLVIAKHLVAEKPFVA